VAARRDIGGKEGAADDPGGQTADPEVAARPDEKQREPGAGERPADACQVSGQRRFLTITAARAA
jgi:hypothetical protein